VDFIVDRRDLRKTDVVPGRDSDASALAPGQALLRIDRFSFTANNITYGAVGDLIGYWSFFPARDGWGRIPVWGFADVVRSRHAALPTGERVYGYFPMSTHVVLQVDRVSGAGFVDAAPHRASLPPIYNQYSRVAAMPGYEPAGEALLALFRPLFTTSFLLDDFLAVNDAFGADAAVLSSASSKTALGLAFLLTERGVETIGLTSPANLAFVERTGCYRRVLAYEEIGSLAARGDTVLVDFAGNAGIVGAVHRTLGERLKHNCAVGLTHWEKRTPVADLPGPAPTFFFAPDHARRRMADWGTDGFRSRVGDAMQRFFASAGRWLRIVEGRGVAAVTAVYRDAVEGRIDPAVGHILSL
jgi:hypothetical protein